MCMFVVRLITDSGLYWGVVSKRFRGLGEDLMRSRTNSLLKDEEKWIRLEGCDSILQKLDELIEAYEKRLLGEDSSSSVKTVSGGRPESNRRKF
jgi:hypothetical protein